jgi:choline dehydrogenase-like flavoprotein
MTYTFASEDYLGKFVIGTTSAMNTMAAQLLRHPARALAKIPDYSRAVGMFVKLRDNENGEVDERGRISKPLDDDDHTRMEEGIDIARDIMAGAGVDQKSVMVARYIGGHPGGTAAVGRLVDASLATEVPGLYVCDSSVIPRSPGVPLVLILVSLAKWFAKSF